jgi:SAM-dependent methyltransferase
MAASCPVGFDTRRLREEVSLVYARVAESPDGDFHFHRGPYYAAEFLRYDADELRMLPARSTAAFAGVGNPHAIGVIERGAVVADIGCGGGMDLLLAARRVGGSGRAIGIDMTESMRRLAGEAALEAGLGDTVEIREGDAEDLPLEDSTIDVVISNGVLNLATDKRKAFAEIARVLKPGGRLQLADIVVESELSEAIRSDIDLWTG